jgi:hypothetical protein
VSIASAGSQDSGVIDGHPIAFHVVHKDEANGSRRMSLAFITLEETTPLIAAIVRRSMIGANAGAE